MPYAWLNDVNKTPHNHILLSLYGDVKLREFAALQTKKRERCFLVRKLIVESRFPRVRFRGFQDRLQSTTGLNREQTFAVQHIVSLALRKTFDFSLWLGMPGTGKTTTIASAVDELAGRKLRVLLCAFTNSAVDNILLKLQERGVQFVR